MTTLRPADGEDLVLQTGHDGSGVSAVIPIDEETLLTAGYGGQIIFWSLATGLHDPPLRTQDRAPVTGVALNPTGETAVVTTSSGAELLDIQNRTLTAIPYLEGEANGPAWLDNERWLLGAADGTLRVGPDCGTLVRLDAPARVVQCIDGYPVVLDTMGLLAKYDPQTGQPVWLRRLGPPASMTDFVAVGNVLLVDIGNGMLSFIDGQTGETQRVVKTETRTTAVGGNLVSAHDDFQIRRWSPEGTLLETFSYNVHQWVESLSPEPGRMAAGLTNGEVRLYEPERTLPAFAVTIRSAAVSNGQLATVGAQGVTVWDTVTGEQRYHLDYSSAYGVALVDDDVVVSTLDGSVVRLSKDGVEQARSKLSGPASRLIYTDEGLLAASDTPDIFFQLDAKSLELQDGNAPDLSQRELVAEIYGRWVIWQEKGEPVEAAVLNDTLLIHREGTFTIPDAARPYLRIWKDGHLREID